MSNTNFRRYGMLSKERETGTILVYVNNFSDPNILKTILNMISKSPKKIFYFSEGHCY